MLNHRLLLSSLVLAAFILPPALSGDLYSGSTPSTDAVCPWWNDHCYAACDAMGSDPTQDADSVTCLATTASGDSTYGNLVPDQGLRLECNCYSYSYVQTTITSNILLEMSPLINKAEGINAAFSNSSETDAICGPWGNVCGRTCNLAQPGTVASSKCIETYDGHVELDCTCGDTEYGNEAMKRLGADLNGTSYTPKASASASSSTSSTTTSSSSSSTTSTSLKSFTTTAAAGAITTSLTTDVQCGKANGKTCTNSEYGSCCSVYGWCGSSSDYCAASNGCQSAFGHCDSAVNGTSKSTSSTTSKAAKTTTASASSSAASTADGSTPTSVTVKVSRDGTCGRGYSKYTCLGSTFGNCCSQYGWCGKSAAYCGTGCNKLYGSCT